MSSNQKPVLFLDVDGVLIRYPSYKGNEILYAKHPRGIPAPGVRDFLSWAFEHFECRWLTAWAVSGTMIRETRESLSKVLDMEPSLFEIPNHSHPWGDNKTQAIDATEFQNGARLGFWLDDDIMKDEQAQLRKWGLPHIFVHTNSSKDPDALFKAKQKIISLAHMGGYEI